MLCEGWFTAEDETCFIQKSKSGFRDVTENGALKATSRLLRKHRLQNVILSLFCKFLTFLY